MLFIIIKKGSIFLSLKRQFLSRGVWIGIIRYWKQVQTAMHKFKRGGVMKHIHIVVINGEEIDLNLLTDEERRIIKDGLNRKAVAAIGYQEEKNA